MHRPESDVTRRVIDLEEDPDLRDDVVELRGVLVAEGTSELAPAVGQQIADQRGDRVDGRRRSDHHEQIRLERGGQRALHRVLIQHLTE